MLYFIPAVEHEAAGKGWPGRPPPGWPTELDTLAADTMTEGLAQPDGSPGVRDGLEAAHRGRQRGGEGRTQAEVGWLWAG